MNPQPDFAKARELLSGVVMTPWHFSMLSDVLDAAEAEIAALRKARDAMTDTDDEITIGAMRQTIIDLRQQVGTLQTALLEIVSLERCAPNRTTQKRAVGLAQAALKESHGN